MAHNNLRFKPIRWLGQFPFGEDGGPKPFPFYIGPLSKFQGQLFWKMHDLCHFHQIIYKDINRKYILLEEQHDIHKKNWREYPPNLDEDGLEWFHFQNIRSTDFLLANEEDIARIKKFSDEYTVIGLSATMERYLFEFITCIESHFPTISTTYNSQIFKWEDFINKFKSKSIILNNLDGYADANECRVLNNAIKHDGIVGDKLAKFPYFEKHKNLELSNLDFEMQRYVNGVSNFLGHLMDSGNRLLGYSSKYRSKTR